MVVSRSRLPWHWFTTVLTLTLLLFLIITTLLNGATGSMTQWDFWRQYLGAPVLIAYIFCIFPYMFRLGRKAAETFRQLQFHEGTNPDDTGYVPQRHWEWTTAVVGAAFWILLQSPWGWDWAADEWWLNLYALISYALLFGLLGWLIYYSLAESRHMNRLSRRKLNIDIFDTSVLTPVARSSLGTSFAFIGGISLSLIFQTVDSLLTWSNITIYAVLVMATLLIFFLSMWSTHRTMADTKHEELSLVRQKLEEGIRKLRGLAVGDKVDETGDLHSAVAAWGTYERHVREAREWPFNAIILRRLAASTLVPGLIYLLKVLLGTRIM